VNEFAEERLTNLKKGITERGLHEAGYFLLGLVSLATVTGLYFWLDAPLVSAAFTY
jgi:hypothetical protein